MVWKGGILDRHLRGNILYIPSAQQQEMTSGRFDLQDVVLLWHGGTETGKATESQADAEESVCRWMVQKHGRGWERSHSPGPGEASQFM